MASKTITTRRNNYSGYSQIRVEGKTLITDLEEDYGYFTLSPAEAQALADWLTAEFGVTGKAPTFTEQFAALKVGDQFTYIGGLTGRTYKNIKVDEEQYYNYDNSRLYRVAAVEQTNKITKVN